MEALGRILDSAARDGEAYLARRVAKGKPVAVTAYDSVVAADVNASVQLERWWKYAQVTLAHILAAGVYIDRFVAKTRVPLTSLNKHSLLMCALLCATKWVQDHGQQPMSAYAAIAGAAPCTLRALERVFLRDMDFHLFVDEEELACYERIVAEEVVAPAFAPAAPAAAAAHQTAGPLAKLRTRAVAALRKLRSNSSCGACRPGRKDVE